MHTNCIHTRLCFGVDPPLPAAPLRPSRLANGESTTALGLLRGTRLLLGSNQFSLQLQAGIAEMAGILDGIPVF